MSTPVPIDQTSALRQAALRFLFERIDYERLMTMPYGDREFKLARMHELLERIGNPQRDMPIVHVAGTKGKGSVTAMIGAVLSAAGYRTGLFTSPHLDRLEERMAVDGEPCSAAELVELVDALRPAIEAIDRQADAASGSDELGGATFFEITTAMALLHFARHKVKAAVLEVGLGGRLDSTNVCTPRVAIITSISVDHTRQLGNTLELIAREKAGIIKPGVPVVSGVVQDEPRRAIRQVCREQGCRLIELGVDFDFQYHPPRHLESGSATGSLDFRYGDAGKFVDVALAPLGRHQATNAAVALAAIVELADAGFTIPQEAIRSGLSGVKSPARVELVARRPAIVLDGAHNEASIGALLTTLDESFSVGRRLLVFAATQDKDLRAMLSQVVGRFDKVVFTRYVENPRAVPPEQLAALAAELGDFPSQVVENPADAWKCIREQTTPDDLICVTGSLFIAAEMRKLILSM